MLRLIHVRARPGDRTKGVLRVGHWAIPVALGRGGILSPAASRFANRVRMSSQVISLLREVTGGRVELGALGDVVRRCA